MRIFASLRIAGRALRRNKMRSLLTMLGIIIGVGAVIGSVSLTSGATKQVEDQVSSLGESVITVFSGNFTQGAMRGGWGSAPTLTVKTDAVAVSGVKNVLAISPEVRDREQVLANGLNWNTQVMGESPDYPQIRNWPIASGSMFSIRMCAAWPSPPSSARPWLTSCFPTKIPSARPSASATCHF
jgi:putative ABC transport system permease protein